MRTMELLNVVAHRKCFIANNLLNFTTLKAHSFCPNWKIIIWLNSVSSAYTHANYVEMSKSLLVVYLWYALVMPVANGCSLFTVLWAGVHFTSSLP